MGTHVRCGNLQRGRWASEPVSKREVVSSLERDFDEREDAAEIGHLEKILAETLQ